MKVKDIRYIAVILLLLVSDNIVAQVMHSGEVVFERKTNLEKRFEDTDRNGWMKGNGCVTARKLHTLRETGVCV